MRFRNYPISSKPIRIRTLSFTIAMTLAIAVAIAALAGAGIGPAFPDPARAAFDVRHELKVSVPPGAESVRVWFTIPQDDPHQEISGFWVESPFPYRVERDSVGENTFLYVEVEKSAVSEFSIVNTFRLTRSEVRTDPDHRRTRPMTDQERRKFRRELDANAHVIINDRVRQLAEEIVGAERNPVLAARKLYDWTLDFTDYWVKRPGDLAASPVGSTEFCLDTGTGNCTDIHSLWASLARAAGIPTRIVYGSFFKKELDGQDVDQSYHCWIEFYAPEIGWIPHDAALAELFTEDIPLTPQNTTLVQRTTPSGYFGKDLQLVDYYFGNLEERRVVWSLGRDLILHPRQEGEPVNAMAKAYVEIDGKPAKEGADGQWVRKLTFVEVSATEGDR